MNIIVSIILFVVGLGLVIYFAEKLVKGAVGTSLGFGISTFLVSVIFIGFDPENLAVGAVGSFEGISGIALGSIIGAAMVTIALAFGITVLFAPMRFEQVPKQILVLPILAVLLLGILGFDGQLSRIDGIVLLLGFVLSIVYLLRLNRRGLDIKPTGEVAETLEEAEELSKWKSFGLLLLSLVAIIIGSAMLVAGSETIIASMGLSDTVFGMTILAFLVSIEELARELPAAMKGRPEISFGNVAGSILAFFLFNAGIIALVSPVTVGPQVLRFYLPLCFGTVIVVSLFMMTKKIPRWAGGIFILLYLVFVIGGYIG
jgi:cation:H+ antiporter